MNWELNSDDYQVGGCLPLDSPTYVKRQADFDFYEGMKRGEFCYVLNSRQMGKSSLRVQTMRRLTAQGVACAAIDLTAIGSQNIEPKEWYAGITHTLANSFNLLDKFDLVSWWCDREILSPLQRLGEFIDKVLLKEIPEPQNIAIFVDEIDSVLSLKFIVDDFFGFIRSCYDKRAEKTEYNRLTWALLGVATPSELIQDKNSTPFNIGREIELTGFQLEESSPLATGLASKTNNAEIVLKAILDWTGGKPFLTQKLCKLVLQAPGAIPEAAEAKWIENLVRSRILHNWEAQDQPEHLRTIRDRLLVGDDDKVSKRLALYQKILLNGEIPADDRNPAQRELRLAGLVVKHQGNLKVYSCIYELIFDASFILKELEKRRPYKAELTAWAASDCLDQSQLLSGEKLQGALAWAADKKLSRLDDQFLKASQDRNSMREPIIQDSGDNQTINSDEQLLYDHWLYLVQQEPPSQLIQRFSKLFIEGVGYPDQEIEAALYRIIGFSNNEKKFNSILNRCCYILINRWQLASRNQDAIAQLVDLFQKSSFSNGKAAFNSLVVKRLQKFINGFIKSDEYQGLQRLVQVIGFSADSNSLLSHLIHRYPYLYLHYLLPEESTFEHRQTIRRLQAEKQQQFELNLSQYIPHLIKRVKLASQSRKTRVFSEVFILHPEDEELIAILQGKSKTIQTVPNPTLLSDEQLYLALKQFVGTVKESRSYRDLAQDFLNHTSLARSYREFKEKLYEYLIDGIDQKYGNYQFNQRLRKYLETTFPESDTQKVDEFLIMRTCSHLFNFLVASPQHPDFIIFFDLISNLGAVNTVALLLKIALLSSQVKPHLEKRFSILFNYYESQEFSDMTWLIQSLENLNVALVTNFGSVDLSSIKQNII